MKKSLGLGRSESNYFVLSGRGLLDEVKQFVNMIEKIEEIRCYWFIGSDPHFDKGVTRILCMDHQLYEELNIFMNKIFKDVQHSNNKYYVEFKLPGSSSKPRYLAYQKTKNSDLLCKYDDFYEILRNRFHLEFVATQCFIKGWIYENLKIETGPTSGSF